MSYKDDPFFQSCEKFLNPDKLKSNLALASVYLASYELLKSAIVENPRGFFNMGTSAAGKDSQDYKAEVTALYPDDRFHASCLWFENIGAIDDDDMAVIASIRKHRNEIAHELPKYLADSHFAVDMQLLDSIHFIVGKIERWWIREIEMQINPEFDHLDADSLPDSEIYGGRLIMMDLIHKIIHGQDHELRQLFQKFQTAWRKKQGGSSSSPEANF